MNNTFSLESLATGLLTEMTRSLSPAAIPHSVASGFVEGAFKALSDPKVTQSLSDMFIGIGCHSGLDVAQDALDACEHGQLSHESALKIVAIALADHQERNLKRG
jgi:hypothetical protein